MKTASFWHKLESGKIECELCPHHCKLVEGATGLCRVRGVKEGELKALYYGIVSSAGMDPIEKKPLYHFYPGSSIMSIGGYGCNFACDFCQNWSISQETREEGTRYRPGEVAAQAGRGGSIGIAYTYNEPLVGFEFVLDCAARTREAGRSNVLVTNGYIESGPAAELLPLVDALNIDVKSMDDDFYRKLCRGAVKPVLAFAAQASSAGCHVEITNLVIPGLNDSDEALRGLARWVRDELGVATPLHLSAYRPEFRMDRPPTPPATLERAHAICSELLSYVYLGNVRTEKGQDTVCPGCGETLVCRSGYQTRVAGIREGACAGCGRSTDFIV